jgi:hypothetical protein
MVMALGIVSDSIYTQNLSYLRVGRRDFSALQEALKWRVSDSCPANFLKTRAIAASVN